MMIYGICLLVCSPEPNLLAYHEVTRFPVLQCLWQDSCMEDDPIFSWKMETPDGTSSNSLLRSLPRGLMEQF
jgi:hypothetical protein